MISMSTGESIKLAEQYGAHNYHPLPVVVSEASGAWVTDVDGRRYLDLLSAYSALNFGHGHPALVEAAHRQLDRLTLTSRAVHADLLGPFCRALADLAGMQTVLLMNTGAEAVESGLKVARKWGYEVKGVAPEQASIIVCSGGFHGRTISIVSFSTDPVVKDGFGPYTPGFRVVPYGDVDAMAAAIDETTVAVLVEPIQGEAGVVVPPAGYLQAVRELCTERSVLLIADEIQSGLGRTGTTFACEHENVRPDAYLLGKALGGGILPVSAMVADRSMLGVLHPGEHGSTFGGNPLACAVGLAVVDLLNTGEFQRRATELGARMRRRLAELPADKVAEVRGRGLWAGVVLAPGMPPARAICERLLDNGIIVKDTHETTLRLAPPLVITETDLDHALDTLHKIIAAT
ncbi:MAG: ornithine--oxo-acid transaminase [Mycobacteriales bacterium]